MNLDLLNEVLGVLQNYMNKINEFLEVNFSGIQIIGQYNLSTDSYVDVIMNLNPEGSYEFIDLPNEGLCFVNTETNDCLVRHLEMLSNFRNLLDKNGNIYKPDQTIHAQVGIQVDP